jgi:amino acid adenylation domain-containing protein
MSQFELTLEVLETPGGLALEWIYRSELFDAATIGRMSGHFVNLLQAAIGQPELNIWSLPMLTVAERRQLLEGWNDTATAFVRDKCVHELFEEQARRTPQAIAIESQRGRVTYAELDLRANRCANYLRAHGVAPGAIVGIFGERSIDMAVAMLGTLKAGGAYLPLDPGYPQARIDYMLSDSRAQIVLTERGLCHRLAESGIVVTVLDEPHIFDAHSAFPHNTSVAVTPISVAYVIYTSGTTGEPKGVMNTHAGLANLCQWHGAELGTNSSSRCTLISSIGFDAAVWELWSALLSGACTVTVSDTERVTPRLLAELLRRQQITHCFVPTALFEAMSETDTFASEYLSVLCCGGDRLTRNCLPAESKARLVNCYGPTEAGVVATSYDVPRSGAPLIGKPIANVSIYILSESLELQPVGVVGEIYIGGVGLSRGYWNDELKTAERFIRDHLSGDAQGRLYRTGDFARILADGNIEFIGRRDRQIKLRGFRVELDEIENRMAVLPQVRAAAAVLREDVPGQKRLTGYVMLNGEQSTSEALAAVREGLRRDLPDYMVPGSLVVLSEFPLTPNGKVDRRRLPPPESADQHPVGALPETATEVMLAEIWSQLLPRSAIAVDTNFFELGGDSLLVIRMIHLIAERLRVQATVKDVFRQPTIRGLAAFLDENTQLEELPSTPARAPATVSAARTMPLSLCQFRVWYIEQMRAGTNEHNMPMAMTLRGRIDAALFERTLNCVVARHDMLRTRFVLHDALPMQVTEESLELSLDWHDLSSVPAPQIPARVQALASLHAKRNFELGRLPLLSALMIRVAEAEYRLQLTFHHLVFDGWSFAIFFDELTQIYEALATGAEHGLPAPVRSYADFVDWQQQWMRSGEAEAQGRFWRGYLEDCPEQLSLPGQLNWPRDPQAVRTRASARLDSDTSRCLATLARSRRGTLFSTLYSAFALLLGRLSGTHDLNIGIPVSGRHVPCAQGVIGNFLNNLPVRNRLHPEQRFVDYLDDQIRNLEQVLSNQDYPLEKILELSARVRKRDATPLFQVFFNMLSVPHSASSRVFDVEFESGVDIEPKFDLTLYVQEVSDGVELACHYNATMFAPAGLEHLLSQYVSLLEQVARNAEIPCGDYLLRPDTEGEGWRDLEPRRCWPGAVPDIFRQRALENPDALAILERSQQWTYREVLQASMRLASELQQRGVGPGDVVGIVAARRGCMVVEVMAVLWAGAAFSLLNPEYPVERVCLLVTILKPAIVLFAGDRPLFALQLTSRLESMAQCLYLPAAKQVVEHGGEVDFVPAQIEPEQLACVTFTSGTTGTPKAVAGIHIGISGYLSWVPQWLEISRTDRFSMLSGLGHDPIQRDMFGPLCTGATLVIPEPEVIAPRLLAEWLNTNGITFVHMTPAMAQILCNTDETHFPSLRIAFLTGEKLHSDVVAGLLGYNDAMRILNSYGTTETQRAVTYFEASRVRDHHGVVPVSETAQDTVIRVLNEQGTHCGLGEVGDIFLESHALSKGYRNDPQLTAKAFTELGDGRRRYRTGDIGCRMPGGRVAVLGRKDSQINIRGFRVETGEIESYARALDKVKDATVLAIQRDHGETVLVIYVVPRQYTEDDGVLRREVLGCLKRALPAHMVPSAVVVLESLPLTPNGKLDRHSLPAPARNDGIDYVAPSGDLEQALASIWTEVLRVERVGVHDDFFALGGHSVLMILLLTHMRKRLAVRFDIAQILPCTTIREQARVLASLSA